MNVTCTMFGHTASLRPKRTIVHNDGRLLVVSIDQHGVTYGDVYAVCRRCKKEYFVCTILIPPEIIPRPLGSLTRTYNNATLPSFN